MQKINGSAERTLDASTLNQQRILDRSTPTEVSGGPPDPLRLNIEMAIEWAHLGGD